MTVTVVIPSRCAIDPRRPDGELFLDTALRSIQQQTLRPAEVRIGVQEYVSALDRLIERYPELHIRIVHTSKPGQSAALNTAASGAIGDAIAFLEDDDTWHPQRLEVGVRALRELECDFVSCSHLVVSADGQQKGTIHFPTPSGWLLSRRIWQLSGGFDESFRWHLDNEFLGKLFRLSAKRVHLVESSVDISNAHLKVLTRFSRIARTQLSQPLVQRLQNPAGGMSRIKSDDALKAQSSQEYSILMERYGFVPW